LNGPQSYARKNSQIGNDGDEAAKPNPAPSAAATSFAANHAMRQRIELFDL
jgi:hypothetical protein